MRLLLVEDDPVLGDGLRAGLRLGGHTVDWLVNGSAAMCALDSGASFCAAILDIGLPGASGLDVLRAWRKRHLTVPVLVLTASGGTSA